jgi:hypothetical protein
MGRITTSASVCRHRLQWSSDSVLSAARGRISRRYERSLTLIGRAAGVGSSQHLPAVNQADDVTLPKLAERLLTQICEN